MDGKLPLGSVLLALLLTACAGQQARIPSPLDWREHSARLQALTNWSASGKLALRTPEQSESASMQWRQRGDSTHLQLSGPLGTAATTVDSDGQSLEIRQGEETRTVDLTDPSELEHRTGWDIPLQALPHWLKGVPAPELDTLILDLGPDPQLLRRLRQGGWDIEYEQYDNFGEFTLPTRLSMQRGATSVRVIIRDWQVSPD